MEIGGVGNSNVDLPVAVELSLGNRQKKWLVTYKGKVVSRHRWRENAIHRARQIAASLEKQQ